MRMKLLAWGTLTLALALWGGFAFLVWTLYGERAAYALAQTTVEEESLRGQSTARLLAAVHDTEAERAALESLLNISILKAVEIIESTGKQAGAEVSIGEATPLSGASAPEALTTVSIVANASGSFSSLVRALGLFETLPVPSTLESFEMEKIDTSWRATVRIKVLLSSTAQ